MAEEYKYRYLTIGWIAGLFFWLIPVTRGFTQEQVRISTELKSDWLFIKSDIEDGAKNLIDETKWEKVSIPHDWAIKGPFNQEPDLQTVKVTEDGDQKAMTRSGRTGGLPYAGIGWYRKHLFFSKKDQYKIFSLEFDGAMSHAKIFVNNRFVGEWPYGYASFSFPITRFIHFGEDNLIAVRLENRNGSSRWYPGAGIYRNVRLIKTNIIHVSHWGTFITTPAISAEKALVNIQIKIEAEKALPANIYLETGIYNQKNEKVAESISSQPLTDMNTQEITIRKPQLWSAENPFLYYAITRIKKGAQVIDQYKTFFGIRSISFNPEKGMLVNNTAVKLKGVCLHDDLGALGMAVNKSALRFRLKLLKEMGCNAIRGSHNPHTPEMLELCDEMGFYFIDEAFDEWKTEKMPNGYHLLFDQWAQKDLEALIQRDRNHPALIMYSIGNEVKEQNEKGGARVARFLTEICHRNDPSRPVTIGCNNINAAIQNGLANAVDIPGLNYKPEQYASLHKQHPNWVIYGSETASTVSSRGVYKLPAEIGIMKIWPDNQSSSYDLEFCSWSQLPDKEWENQQNEFVAGEFVWTGFDYLGEPTPYNDNWPSRSSYFGILDLSGSPKDRYYLYQSQWTSKKVLHILPHWNWEGNEGSKVPVYVYTNYPAAELFINGKSFGKRKFDNKVLLDRYRLRWENTIYERGELKVVAYDESGNTAETKIIRTAGSPATISLEPNRNFLTANGEDLAFVTVSIRDKKGNPCPLAKNLIGFTVTGAGKLRAVDNGNPASLEPFEFDKRKAFSGKCMAIIQSSNEQGIITVTASGAGLQSAILKIKTSK
jgi:beta-galactosidase